MEQDYRLRGDGFAATHGIQSLAGFSLDADAILADVKGVGQTLSHQIDMLAEFRSFEHHGRVGVGDIKAPFVGQPDDTRKQLQAVGVLPLLITVRKMHAEVAFAQGFKAGGGELVGSVRVPLQNPDFAPYMQRVKDAKPDALMAFVYAV